MNVGASWQMTTLSPSPLIIAMVQAATSLPLFLLAMPAGALADIVNRRTLLLITQLMDARRGSGFERDHIRWCDDPGSAPPSDVSSGDQNRSE